jgi:ferredoxin-NADP reductase
MNRTTKHFVEPRMRRTTSAALLLLAAGSGVTGLAAQNPVAAATREKQVETTQSKFYCKIKALTPEERAHHKQLTEKLMATRKEIVETAKGYEFQFSPKSVSLAELANWVSAESKCCPFFDFHIDLEGEGSLLCLRLTGEEGIKEFIRGEFSVQ